MDETERDIRADQFSIGLIGIIALYISCVGLSRYSFVIRVCDRHDRKNHERR